MVLINKKMKTKSGHKSPWKKRSRQIPTPSGFSPEPDQAVCSTAPVLRDREPVYLSLCIMTHVCIIILIVVCVVDRKKRKLQKKCNKCSKAVNQTTISKMCDTCLEHVHLKCEDIRSLSDIKSKFFTCGVCRDRPTAK